MLASTAEVVQFLAAPMFSLMPVQRIASVYTLGPLILDQVFRGLYFDQVFKGLDADLVFFT